MTDQTRWNIDEVQMKNKIKARVDQVEMRNELKNFVSECSVIDLQDIYKYVKNKKGEK
jgi:hypothetical protein